MRARSLNVRVASQAQTIVTRLMIRDEVARGTSCDTCRQNKNKKVRVVEQLDLDRLGQTINVSVSLTKKNDKENVSGRQPPSKHRKRSTDDRIISATFRRDKNTSQLLMDDQQTIKPKSRTKRTSRDNVQLGKSLDYRRYLNKALVNKGSKSQSCSPRKKSLSRQPKLKRPITTATKSRPSSVGTSNNNTLNTLLNNKFNRTDNSNRLRDLLNSMKNEDSGNLREILEKSFQVKPAEIDLSIEKSTKKLRTKKKNVQRKKKQSSTTTTKMREGDSEQPIRCFYKKKPLDEVCEDANIPKVCQDEVNRANSLVTVSASVGFDPTQKQITIDRVRLTLQDSDDLNIIQMRDFEKRKIQHVQSKNYSGYGDVIFNIMARKIQRAWRKYCTGKLLNRYIGRFEEDTEEDESSRSIDRTDSYLIEEDYGSSDILQRIGRNHAPSSEDDVIDGRPLQIQTTQFYQEQNPKVTVVSNLSQIKSCEEDRSDHPTEQRINKYEKLIQHLRQDELNRWNHIVQIITDSFKAGQDVDAQELLRRVIMESEQNREKLIKESNKTAKKIEESRSEKEISNFHSLDQDKEEADSESDPFQQFNSKKYKELLDPKIVDHLIKSREKFLAERQRTQKRLIDTKYELDEISIGSYKRNCQKLEKWVSKQKISIQKTRRQIQMGLGKAKEAIKKTQLDYVIMMKLKGSPSQPLHKSMSEEALNKKWKICQRTIEQDAISLTSSQKELQKYMNNASFDDEQELEQSNTQRLRLKLHKLNEQSEPSSPEPELATRILRRQTNEPLHKLHFDVSEHNSSDAISVQERAIAQSVKPVNNSSRILELLKDNSEPERITEEVCKEAFDEMVLEFLKDVSSLDFFIDNFKKLKINKIQKKRQRGIKTNIGAVRQYIKNLEQFLINKKISLLSALERPTGPSAKQMLKYMHYYDDEQIQEEDDVQNTILPNGVFQEHWKEIQSKIEFQPMYPQPEKEKARVEYLKGLTRIHCLAIFQAYNECLDLQRNFGTFGQPFPWKRTANFFHQKREPITIMKCLQKTNKRLNGIATSFCGIIFDRQDCSVEYSEEYIAQIQDDRVTRMLALEVMQGQHKWLFYDDEQTEILVEVSFVISQTLINQLVLQLHQMMNLR